MNITQAKAAIDKVMRKARVHFYKPIQVGEILYNHRVTKKIKNLRNLTEYKNESKKWRDDVCSKIIGRISTSSARYQEDLFNENAVPPKALVALAKENNEKGGIVEAYIYRSLVRRLVQLSVGCKYCDDARRDTFNLSEFLAMFREERGLRRSIDKVYEMVVYALFSVLVEKLRAKVSVSVDPAQMGLLKEFADFAKIMLCVDENTPKFETAARLYRVGVTNAADTGIDMWANFGPVIQVKHLGLDAERAADITEGIVADRIVIVCRSFEKNVIVSLVTQLGLKGRIQGIVTEEDLVRWYEKALRGRYSKEIGDFVLSVLREEIQREFPSVGAPLVRFIKERGYDKMSDAFWMIED